MENALRFNVYPGRNRNFFPISNASVKLTYILIIEILL